MFEQLKTQVPDSNKIQEVMSYIESQWIDKTTFNIHSWSVYKQEVRTNNDVEGWHHKLNSSAKHAALNLYKLIDILHNEAIDVQYACRFVEDGVLSRRQHSANNIHKNARRTYGNAIKIMNLQQEDC